VIDEYPTAIEPRVIPLAVYDVEKMAGKRIDKQTISSILLNLGFENSAMSEEKLSVTIPHNKHDIKRPVDLIEEVLRIYGFNNIDTSSEIKYLPHSKPYPTILQFQKKISTYLADNGFIEMMNNSITRGEYASIYDFLDETERVDLVNPLNSELNALRQSMLLSGLETIELNLNNKNNNLKLFEFGKTYHIVNKEDANPLQRFSEREKLALFVTGKTSEDNWIEPSQDLDFFFIKNYVENILHKSGVSFTPVQCVAETPLNNGLFYLIKDNYVLAKAGQIEPKILKYFGIKKSVYYAVIDIIPLFEAELENKMAYTRIATHPSVKRDLALVVDKHITYQQLEKVATQLGSRHIKKVSLFDVYEGDKLPKGKKQYALNFVLQHPDKTMTDAEINKIMGKLVSAFEKGCGASLR
jgi:phenylalanyl-tRNA synthetase beta chain